MIPNNSAQHTTSSGMPLFPSAAETSVAGLIEATPPSAGLPPQPAPHTAQPLVQEPQSTPPTQRQPTPQAQRFVDVFGKIILPETLARLGEDIAVMRWRNSIDNAFEALKDVPFDEIQGRYATPEMRQQLGLDPEQMQEVAGRHKTYALFRTRQEEEAHRQQEHDSLQTVLQAATATENTNPLTVRTLIQQSAFDAPTKAAILQAHENGRINTHDNPEYTNTLHTRLAQGETITDNDLMKGVLAGNLTVTTMERVKAHRQAMQGSNRYLVQNAMQHAQQAYAALPPPATPEEAMERAQKLEKVHDELMYLVEEGTNNGTLRELMENTTAGGRLANILHRQLGIAAQPGDTPVTASTTAPTPTSATAPGTAEEDSGTTVYPAGAEEGGVPVTGSSSQATATEQDTPAPQPSFAAGSVSSSAPQQSWLEQQQAAQQAATQNPGYTDESLYAANGTQSPSGWQGNTYTFGEPRSASSAALGGVDITKKPAPRKMKLVRDQLAGENTISPDIDTELAKHEDEYYAKWLDSILKKSSRERQKDIQQWNEYDKLQIAAAIANNPRMQWFTDPTLHGLMMQCMDVSPATVNKMLAAEKEYRKAGRNVQQQDKVFDAFTASLSIEDVPASMRKQTQAHLNKSSKTIRDNSPRVQALYKKWSTKGNRGATQEETCKEMLEFFTGPISDQQIVMKARPQSGALFSTTVINGKNVLFVNTAHRLFKSSGKKEFALVFSGIAHELTHWKQNENVGLHSSNHGLQPSAELVSMQVYISGNPSPRYVTQPVELAAFLVQEAAKKEIIAALAASIY